LLHFILKRIGNWKTLMWIVIIIGLIGVSYYYGFKGMGETSVESYDEVRDRIQQAVTAYSDDHEGTLPTLNRTVTVDNTTMHLIDLCQLTYRGEFLPRVPPGCAYDNCVAGRCMCTNGSYIWTVDAVGNVSSTCIALGCEAYQADGYQGVWP